MITAESEPDEVIDEYLKDIVGKACSRRTGKIATAINYLFVRAANTRLSIQTLSRTAGGFESHRLDNAVLLRVMYDAFIQAEYIMWEPKERLERATQYVEYEHIERYLTESKIEKHDNILSRGLKNSPRRDAGRKRNKKQYDRVEHLFSFLDKKGKKQVRPHWYQGQMKQLAQKVDREHEYDTFVTNYHGCTHSSVYAIKNGPHANEQHVYLLSNTLAARMLLLSIEANRIKIPKEQRDFLKSVSMSVLDLTEKDRPK